MKKAELEHHAAQHDEYVQRAAVARDNGQFKEMLDVAVAGFSHVDGWIQYKKRYDSEIVESSGLLGFVLIYAPLTLSVSHLDSLGALLVDTKRIDRVATDDLDSQLKTAYSCLWHNRKFYAFIRQFDSIRQDVLQQSLGHDQSYWRWVCEKWEDMKIVARQKEGGSYRVSLVTRLSALARAKCATCGTISESPKREFLSSTICVTCQAARSFVYV